MSAKEESSIDVDTIEASFAAVAPQAEKLVERFYEELFKRYPDVQPMFADADIREQRGKLLSALKLVVANVRTPESLVPALEEMGRRHQGYGAVADHYGAVAATLLDVMQEIAGPAWTPEVQKAWSGALGLIAEIMLGAYSAPAEAANESSADSTAAA